MSLSELIRGNSGRALAAAIADGTVARDEVVAAYFETAAREATVRAFVHFDRGQVEAPPTHDGPLQGLPVGIKDIADVAGMPTRCGSPIYRDNIAFGDAPVVTMIRRAGGRIAGKTVTTEFATRHPGPTTNPYNPKHTPGGSSSGSAAGVAAGMFPFAIGTQTGGSVIRPGAYCGIAAFKPTFGSFPYAGVKATSWHLDTVGCYGKTVRDAAFFAGAVSGQDLAIGNEPSWRPRIGIMPMASWDECSAEMIAAVEAAAREAERRGAVVSRLACDPVYETAFASHLIVQDVEIAKSLAWEFDRFEYLLSPVLHAAIRQGQAIASADYARALDDQRAATRATPELFGNIDVLLAPSAPSAAPLGLASTGSPNLNRLWTMLGTPAVNVPGLADKAGMPLGVQIIGPINGDALTLRAAAWLEDALNG